MYKYNPKYQYAPQNYQYPVAIENNDDRLIGGGFLGPFVLGGLTGGLVAPYFYRPYPQYYPYPQYPYRPRW